MSSGLRYWDTDLPGRGPTTPSPNYGADLREIALDSRLSPRATLSSAMAELPTGTVTFLVTDIEGSTRLLQELGDRYAAVRDEHAAIVRRAIAEGDGSFS
jgi:class 3 adenylate cyclase